MARFSAVAVAGLTLLMVAAAPAAPRADDGWNPFKEQDRRADRAGRSRPADPATEPLPEPLPPMAGVATRPWAETGASTSRQPSDPVDGLPLADQPIAPWARTPANASPAVAGAVPSDSVQRGELSPAVAADGSGLAAELWQGLDATRLPELIAPLSLPPRSAALADTWRRLWTSESSAPANGPRAPSATSGAGSPPTFAAVRIETLLRSGLTTDLARILKDRPADASDPTLGFLTARALIQLGERDAGCAGIKALHRTQSTLPKPARSEFLVAAAYCGASGGDAGAAGLAADLLRAESVDARIPLAVLDTIAAGATSTFRAPDVKRIGLLDYRFLTLARAEVPTELMATADPSLLAIIAGQATDPGARVFAAEAALSVHALTPNDVAAVYRAVAGTAQAGERPAPHMRRALAFKAIESERTPASKARLARTFLDEVRRARGPYQQFAAMLAPAIADIRPAPEIGWFAETAVEINLAAGRHEAIRSWTDPPAAERYGGLRHWLVLSDIADPKWRGRRGEDLEAVEQFAVRGRLAPELMHRLVTVLDALDYQIPIPLWEAASRSPQPATGHLPETGILSQLQEAAKKKEHARTVLLGLRSLGPDTGETAHVIALGDTIRALRRAGLEPDARRLGLEALFAGWPRATNN